MNNIKKTPIFAIEIIQENRNDKQRRVLHKATNKICMLPK